MLKSTAKSLFWGVWGGIRGGWGGVRLLPGPRGGQGYFVAVLSDLASHKNTNERLDQITRQLQDEE